MYRDLPTWKLVSGSEILTVKRSTPRLLILFGLFGSIASASLCPAPAHAEEKSAVKAALVYNILRFVTLPGNPAAVRICAQASDAVASDLRKLEGRTVGRARVNVVLVSSVANMGSSCDVVYLDDESPRAIGNAARGQILIGSARNFAENGGTVGLISFGGQVRFVINANAARRSGVTFSSQLMQLAAKVIS